ncbi:hypothetical protein GCM10022236_34590 [Microlunatus ginsengisoli]|uniref:Uncharacterized protein n=1 Tax=Microlunatus ginsengisoli TaxID=363863 RepID=A0ABP7AC87_9ACTN
MPVAGSKEAPSRSAGRNGPAQLPVSEQGWSARPPSTTNRSPTQAATASCRADSGAAGSSVQRPAASVGAAVSLGHGSAPAAEQAASSSRATNATSRRTPSRTPPIFAELSASQHAIARSEADKSG